MSSRLSGIVLPHPMMFHIPHLSSESWVAIPFSVMTSGISRDVAQTFAARADGPPIEIGQSRPSISTPEFHPIF
jgi:hypothetical protein